MFPNLDNTMGRIATFITIGTFIFSVIVSVLGYFAGFRLEISLLIIILVLLLVIGFFNLRIYTEIVPLKSARLLKRYKDSKIYIFLRGQWRHIPDPDTFRYLATVFDYQPDGMSVIEISDDEFKKYRIGPRLERIKDYIAGSKSTTELIIHHALWGAKGIMNDVTSEVSKRVSAGKLDLVADINTLGNPIQEEKWLMVAYSSRGDVHIKAVVENNKLSLP